MDYSEKWGNSVDEAVELALKDLKLTIDEVDVEVLEEPTKGILGLGRKPGLVRVTKKGATAEKTDGDAAFEEVRAQVSGTKKEEVKEEPVAAEAAPEVKAEEAHAQEEGNPLRSAPATSVRNTVSSTCVPRATRSRRHRAAADPADAAKETAAEAETVTEEDVTVAASPMHSSLMSIQRRSPSVRMI